MPLTLGDLKGHAQHALQGGQPSSLIGSLATLVNRAGHTLFSMNRWNFARREPINLSLVADQDFMELPAEFGEYIGVSARNATLRIVTQAEVARQDPDDTLDVTVGGYFTGYISWPRVAITDPSDRNPRIFIVPTPSATQTDAFRMYWRAGWQLLVDDDEVANVPPWIEPLLELVVREYARGVENDALPEAYQIVSQSAFFRDARAYDGTLQPIGRVRGGAVEDVLRMQEFSGQPGYLFTEEAEIP